MLTVTREVDIDVDLSDFSDDEILEEVEARGLEDEFHKSELPDSNLERIYRMIVSEAPNARIVNEMHDYCRDKLGTAL